MRFPKFWGNAFMTVSFYKPNENSTHKQLNCQDDCLLNNFLKKAFFIQSHLQYRRLLHLFQALRLLNLIPYILHLL